MQFFSLAATIILGLALGLLTNYFADTLPATGRLGKPVCGHCHENLAVKDYSLFKPCGTCGKLRPVRFWVVLAVYAIAAVLFWANPPQRVGVRGGLILVAYFGTVFVIDLEHKLILRPTSAAGMLICGFLGWKMHGAKETFLGGGAGFSIMLVLYYLGVLFAKFLSRKRDEPIDEVALGFGDVILSFILGLLLGWPGITAGLFFAVLAGGLGSGIYILVNKLTKEYKPFTAIPYAPFLLLGAAILIFVLPVTP